MKFVSGLRDSRLIYLSRYIKLFYIVLVSKLPFISPRNYSEEFNAFSWPGLSVLAGEFSLIIQVLQFCLFCVWLLYADVFGGDILLFVEFLSITVQNRA